MTNDNEVARLMDIARQEEAKILGQLAKPTGSEDMLRQEMQRAEAYRASHAKERELVWARLNAFGLMSKAGAPKMGVAAWQIAAQVQLKSRKPWFDIRRNRAMLGDQVVDKDVVAQLQVEIEVLHGAKCAAEAAYTTVLRLCREAGQRDPVEEWLRGLEGKPGAIKALADVMRLDGPEAACLRRWMMAAAARATKGADAESHEVLVLYGRQGVGKSAFFKALVPERSWFTEYTEPLDHKDFVTNTSGPWLVELAELETLRGKEMTAAKGIISRSVDIYTAKYMPESSGRERRFVFCGTTNNPEWNPDGTGGRRFLPIRLKHTKKGELRDAIERLGAKAIEAAWAEALAAVDKGEQWWLTDDETDAIAEAREAIRIADPWEDALDDVLAETTQKQWTFNELAEAVTGNKSISRGDTYRLKEVLRGRLEYKHVVLSGGRRARRWVLTESVDDVPVPW